MNYLVKQQHIDCSIRKVKTGKMHGFSRITSSFTPRLNVGMRKSFAWPLKPLPPFKWSDFITVPFIQKDTKVLYADAQCCSGLYWRTVSSSGLRNKREMWRPWQKIQKEFLMVVFKIQSESSNSLSRKWSLSKKWSSTHSCKQHEMSLHCSLRDFHFQRNKYCRSEQRKRKVVSGAQILHLGCTLQLPGKVLKIPMPMKTGSLWAGPRHQYFWKLPRWLWWTAKNEKRAVFLLQCALAPPRDFVKIQTMIQQVWLGQSFCNAKGCSSDVKALVHAPGSRH